MREILFSIDFTQLFFLAKPIAGPKTDPRCSICHGEYEYTRNILLKEVQPGKNYGVENIYLQEVESITHIDRPSDQKLVYHAVINARPANAKIGVPRWICVRDVFAVGGTTAMLLCREAGLNPDEFLNGQFCNDCHFDPENNENS